MTVAVRWCLLLVLVVNGLYDVALFAADDDPPNASLDDLSWMAGTWVQSSGESRTEEHWLAPQGNLMLGVSRTIRGPRTSFEYLRIAPTDQGLVYFASPQGRPPTEFRLTSLKDKRVVFENPEHDFPQQISYWLDEKGELHARVEGLLRGEKRGHDFHWQRAK
jgi:hypothetical protein